MKETKSLAFRAARLRKYSSSSGSLRARGMSSIRRKRNLSGIPEKSFSIESTPIAASISSRSALELGIYLIVYSLPRESPYGQIAISRFFRIVFVLFGRHQLRRFVLIAETDSNHPTRTIRILVNGFRRITQSRIDFDDFSGCWSE